MRLNTGGNPPTAHPYEPLKKILISKGAGGDFLPAGRQG